MHHQFEILLHVVYSRLVFIQMRSLGEHVRYQLRTVKLQEGTHIQRKRQYTKHQSFSTQIQSVSYSFLMWNYKNSNNISNELSPIMRCLYLAVQNVLNSVQCFSHWALTLPPKLYIPSTLNIDLILWHTQLIVCAVKH